MELQRQWQSLAEDRGIVDCGSKVIVDDVLVYGRDQEQLLKYFEAVLDILKHCRATINLKKCKWFQDNCEFVGVDVGAKGNNPSRSKFEAFEKLERLQTWSDLRMLIGVFGFYSKHLPLFELVISPWRKVLAQQPSPGDMSKSEEASLMTSIWMQECEALLSQLK